MLLWIIAKLLIHFLFAIIWEMKNMLFYMLLFHIFKQWGLIVGSDKLVNIPTNITIKQLLYCNACDGISSFENDGIGYFLGVADVTPTNIIFRFKENPQTFRWFILSK
jgi:hypothetical protein